MMDMGDLRLIGDGVLNPFLENFGTRYNFSQCIFVQCNTFSDIFFLCYWYGFDFSQFLIFPDFIFFSDV